MTWEKINNTQRKCGDYVIAKNHCSASNLRFALKDSNGRFINEFERYLDAIKFYEAEIKND